MKRDSTIMAERSAERIRADLERTRAELSHLLQALRQEVARSIDWREWYRHRPGTFLMAAFTLGFIAGTRRRR